MGDLRTYFGLAFVVVVAVMFAATLFSVGISNGGYGDTGQFPIKDKTDAYVAKLSNNTQVYAQATKSSFEQNPFIIAANAVVGGLTTAFNSISLVLDAMLIIPAVISDFAVTPIIVSLGLTPLFMIATIFISGTILLLIAAVTLKWFV